MKKLLIGLVLVSSVSAIAHVSGLPEEDPVVKSLRDRFEMATSPTPQDLLRKEFDCKFFWATKGKFLSYSNKKSFTSHDGLYIQSNAGSVFDGVAMVDNGKEVIGVTTYKEAAVYEALRLSDKGDLLVERSEVNHVKPALTPIANAGNDTTVYAYGVCVAKP